MSESNVVKNACRCTLCGAPADRYPSFFQCQNEPGHVADLNTGIFTDLAYGRTYEVETFWDSDWQPFVVKK